MKRLRFLLFTLYNCTVYIEHDDSHVLLPSVLVIFNEDVKRNK